MIASKDIFVAVYWPETQELMEDPEFLNNAVLINDGVLYDEYGSSSYMVRADWLLKRANEGVIKQMIDEEALNDIQKVQDYL